MCTRAWHNAWVTLFERNRMCTLCTLGICGPHGPNFTISSPPATLAIWIFCSKKDEQVKDTERSYDLPTDSVWLCTYTCGGALCYGFCLDLAYKQRKPTLGGVLLRPHRPSLERYLFGWQIFLGATHLQLFQQHPQEHLKHTQYAGLICRL